MGLFSTPYVIESELSLSHWSSIIKDTMNRILKNVSKSMEQYLGSIHGLGPATSTSTSTGATDLMLSIPSCDSDGIASAQVTADVSVSVSFALRIFRYWLITIEQTAHNFGVSTSVSALEISDLPLVSVPAAGVNILNNHLITAMIRLPMTTSDSLLRFPRWRSMILLL